VLQAPFSTHIIFTQNGNVETVIADKAVVRRQGGGEEQAAATVLTQLLCSMQLPTLPWLSQPQVSCLLYVTEDVHSRTQTDKRK